VVAISIGRAAAGVIGAAALAMTAAACSSGSGGDSPSASASARTSLRVSSIDALLAQCAILRDIGGVAGSAAKASAALPADQQWLHAGQITLTKASGSQFNAWYQGHLAGMKAAGASIDQWGAKAVDSGKLPEAVCAGSGGSAHDLYQQVYAKYPSMLKHNPWPA
jgi:hypothetical protein